MATWREYDGSRHDIAESSESEVDEILTDNVRFCGVNLWEGWSLDDKKQLSEWILSIDINQWEARHASQGVNSEMVEWLLEPPVLEEEESEEAEE